MSIKQSVRAPKSNARLGWSPMIVALLVGGAVLTLAACPGPAGPPGISGYEIVEVEQSITMAPGDEGVFVTATCPDGKKVLGGGYSSGGFFTFLNSSPVGDNAWQVLVVNRYTTTFTAPVFVRAICAVVEE